MLFDMRNIIVCIVGLAIAALLLRLFKRPIFWAVRLLLSCAAGVIILLLFNMLSSKTGVVIPINPFNGLVMGVLGLPGLVLLWALTVFV